MPTPFFEEQQARPFDDDDRLPPFETPAWTGPPWHEKYGSVLLGVEIGRSTTTVVSLGAARCYQEGLAVELLVRVRETGRQARHRIFSYLERAHGRGHLDERLKPGGLRWGVAFSDGRKVTTQDESPWARVGSMEDLVEGPVIEGLSRPVVDMDSWARYYWLWPTPPPATMLVGFEWEERGIGETLTVVDVAPLIAAGAASEPLWQGQQDAQGQEAARPDDDEATAVSDDGSE
ncbi:hypothetical protein [Arthrobacter agilis]|uniref:hypothetical protein n=1 Tax=Arthrobacter agilis TaxID=37921 RepID=UPI002781DE84|nr:hypothetical protein [Arthrobacter agilis]MDQ0734518.1 hypothetical protein [Arthrobacter agilis]